MKRKPEYTENIKTSAKFYNRLSACVLIVAVLLSSLNVNVRHVKAAAFVADNKFYVWLCDFIIQVNTQRAYEEIVAYYQTAGIPAAGAAEMAQDAVKNVTLMSTFMNDVKTTYAALTAAQKGAVIDCYLQITAPPETTTGADGDTDTVTSFNSFSPFNSLNPFSVTVYAADTGGQSPNGGGGSTVGGGGGRYYGGIGAAVEPFDKDYNNNVSVDGGRSANGGGGSTVGGGGSRDVARADGNAAYGGGVMPLEEFFNGPYAALWTDYGGTFPNSLIAKSRLVNNPYVRIMTSVRRLSNSSSPLGYSYEKYFTVAYSNSDSIYTLNPAYLTYTETSSISSPPNRGTISDIICISQYTSSTYHTDFQYLGNYGNGGTTFYGKLLSVDNYYLTIPAFGAPSIDGALSIDVLINNIFDVGISYSKNTSGTANNYYYEYNANDYSTITNNNYVYDSDWLNVALSVLKDSVTQNIAYITINNYYGSDGDDAADGGANGGGNGGGGGNSTDLTPVFDILGQIKRNDEGHYAAVGQFLPTATSFFADMVGLFSENSNLLSGLADSVKSLADIVSGLDTSTTVNDYTTNNEYVTNNNDYTTSNNTTNNTYNYDNSTVGNGEGVDNETLLAIVNNTAETSRLLGSIFSALSGFSGGGNGGSGDGGSGGSDGGGGSLFDGLTKSVASHLSEGIVRALLMYFLGGEAVVADDLIGTVIGHLLEGLLRDLFGSSGDGDETALSDGFSGTVTVSLDELPEVLKAAFVPRQEFLDEKVDHMRAAFEERIPLLADLAEFIRQLKEVADTASLGSSGDYLIPEFGNSGLVAPDSGSELILLGSGGSTSGSGNPFSSSVPKFEITLPEKYGGQTVSVLDLSYFDQYREFIHSLISVIAIFMFIRRMLRRLPRIIHSE